MPIRAYKPTTNGRRGMTSLTFEEITTNKPEKSLLAPLKRKGGRNNNGRITTRHQGGGHKRAYRIIDVYKRQVLCGSAYKNKGVQLVLDAVIDYLPSPLDVPAIKGTTDDGEEVERKAGDNEPFSALAFKIMTDPFVGKLAFFRVYSCIASA